MAWYVGRRLLQMVPVFLGATLLIYAIVFALSCYAVASVLVLIRLIGGPRAQDRVFALDLLYLHGMLVMLVLGIIGLDQAVLLQRSEDQNSRAARGLIAVSLAVALFATSG